MRRSRVRLLVLCVLALAIPLAATAQEQFTEFIEMPDGVLLATEVYLPQGDGPWPVVLVRTPYGRMDTSQIMVGPPSIFTEDGYAHVAQDIRGTADSGGEWDFANETVDGHTTINWITGQWWCDGNISMGGLSAGGMTSFAVAIGSPDAVKALRAEATTPDSYHHGIYPGGAFRGAWGAWLISMGFNDDLEEVLEHRLLDEAWDPYQWINRSDQVHTPMLHIGGWYDLYLQGALDAFVEFQHNGGDGARDRQYLIVGPWGHDDSWGRRSAGNVQYPENAEIDLEAIRAAFRDYWVKGASTGVDQWPAVQVYLMGAVEEEDAPGNRWIELDDWPPWSFKQPWYLDADGSLASTVAPTGAVTITMNPDDPVPTVGGANPSPQIGPLLQYRAEDRDDVLTFTSEVLEQPVAIMGPVTASIWIRPDTPDLDLERPAV